MLVRDRLCWDADLSFEEVIAIRFPRIVALVAFANMAACGLYAQQVPSLPLPAGVPDMIFYNGKIVTVDTAFHIQQAFALKGEQFLAVGSNAAMRRMAGPKTRQIDLHGSTVIPGLMDDHNHEYAAAMRKPWRRRHGS